MVNHHLVVGANRGIGLALVQEMMMRYPEDIVFATVRDPTKSGELDGLSATYGGRVKVLHLDMLDEAQVVSVAKDLTDKGQTLESVIVNGAAIAGRGPLPTLSPEDLFTNLQVNVVGPHTIIKHFSPLLVASQAPKRSLILMTTAAASITMAKFIGDRLKTSYGLDHVPISGYLTSKTALNMLGRQWANVLEPKGVAVVQLHPGRVETELGKGMQGNISPEESAKGCIDALEKADLGKTGEAMLGYDGTSVPW